MKCESPKAVDVWEFYDQIPDNDNDKKICPLCRFEHKAKAAADKFYFDFKLWELTKLSIKSIVFFPQRKSYSPSLQISDEQFLKVMRHQKKAITKYGPATTDFEIKVKLTEEELRNAIPVLLRRCFKDN